MDIIVNINSLNQPITGIGRSTVELLKVLITENNIQGFDLINHYTHQQLVEKLYHLDDVVQGGKSLTREASLLRQVLRKSRHVHTLKQLIQSYRISKKLQQCNDFIYWEPNYILQPFDGLSVATIHDLSHIKYPEYQTIATRSWLDDNLEETITRADLLIAVSEFTKQEIIQHFSVPEHKVQVVTHAVSEQFKIEISDQHLVKIKNKYGLPKKYILSVGTLEPRKNLQRLIKAYQQLPKKIKQEYPLVLVGAKGWGHMESLIQTMITKHEIIKLGYVAQQDISAIYRGASLFTYLSLYEGYGMPVAEAMASGVAVITSENSAMSEISGDAAKLVNPLDEQAITEAIQYYLENEQARQKLADKGKLKMQYNTWQNSANTLQKTFNQLKNNDSNV